MPGRPLATSRRTALVGLMGMAALAACDVDDLRPPEEGASPPPAGETPAPDADTALVASAVAAIVGTQQVVALARRRFTRLRPALSPLLRAHGEHLAVLAGEQEAPGATEMPASAAHALRQVRAAERQLQHELVAAAVQAHSGALARLLASISASVAQHLAVLPSAPPPEPGR